MSTLERMLKERDRLLAEAKKIDDAIQVLKSFQNDSIPAPQKVKKERASRNSGIVQALRESFKDAIITHGRPVTREEVLQFLPKRGYAKTDIDNKQFSSYAYEYFSGEGIRGKRNTTYWFKDQPRPEKAEWKQELEKLK